jgi:hypothetical protein
MAATNPDMVHVVEHFGQKTTVHNGATVRVFGRVFWMFEQCASASKHCRPIISVDGTLLIGKFKGILLVIVANDANNRLMPLSLSLVALENNDNWE